MENKTELEKKLFEYIRFLLGIINVEEKALQLIGESLNYIVDIYDWRNQNFTNWNAKEKRHEMFEFLNKEFDWNFHDAEIEELIEKPENNKN